MSTNNVIQFPVRHNNENDTPIRASSTTDWLAVDNVENQMMDENTPMLDMPAEEQEDNTPTATIGDGSEILH